MENYITRLINRCLFLVGKSAAFDKFPSDTALMLILAVISRRSGLVSLNQQRFCTKIEVMYSIWSFLYVCFPWLKVTHIDCENCVNLNTWIAAAKNLWYKTGRWDLRPEKEFKKFKPFCVSPMESDVCIVWNADSLDLQIQEWILNKMHKSPARPVFIFITYCNHKHHTKSKVKDYDDIYDVSNDEYEVKVKTKAKTKMKNKNKDRDKDKQGYNNNNNVSFNKNIKREKLPNDKQMELIDKVELSYPLLSLIPLSSYPTTKFKCRVYTGPRNMLLSRDDYDYLYRSIDQVFVNPDIYKYLWTVQRELVSPTNRINLVGCPGFPLSPYAMHDVIHVCKAFALFMNQNYVTSYHVKIVLMYYNSHRIFIDRAFINSGLIDTEKARITNLFSMFGIYDTNKNGDAQQSISSMQRLNRNSEFFEQQVGISSENIIQEEITQNSDKKHIQDIQKKAPASEDKDKRNISVKVSNKGQETYNPLLVKKEITMNKLSFSLSVDDNSSDSSLESDNTPLDIQPLNGDRSDNISLSSSDSLFSASVQLVDDSSSSSVNYSEFSGI